MKQKYEFQKRELALGKMCRAEIWTRMPSLRGLKTVLAKSNSDRRVSL
jgi:hypothetical protein